MRGTSDALYDALTRAPPCLTLINSPVGVPTRALLLLRGDYRLEVLLPPLLPITAVRSHRVANLLGLVDGGLLDAFTAIHVQQSVSWASVDYGIATATVLAGVSGGLTGFGGVLRRI